MGCQTLSGPVFPVELSRTTTKAGGRGDGMNIIRTPDGEGYAEFTMADLLEPIPLPAYRTLRRDTIEIHCFLCGCIHKFSRKDARDGSVIKLPCSSFVSVKIETVIPERMPPEARRVGAGNARRKAEAEARGERHSPKWEP